MLARNLILASAAIVFAMGTGHLLMTFFSRAFHPRDATLRDKMETAPTFFNTRMLMWKVWIGFNASHSMGPMLFGLIYGYLALEHPAFLFSSPFLLWLGAATLAFYLFLAVRYWFYAPLIGIAVTLCLYAGAMAAAWAG